MKTVPKTYRLADIWKSYSNTILSENPECWGVYKHKIPNYFIYRKYYDENGKRNVIEVFSWQKFKGIVEDYYDRAKQAVIEGECIDMKSKLGKICARRVQRNHNKRSINYAKTRLQPKVYSEKHGREVRAKIIYNTGDDWCRIAWNKFSQIPNESVYEFCPASHTKSGACFKQQFSKALEKNPLLRYRYPYYPLKSREE